MILLKKGFERTCFPGIEELATKEWKGERQQLDNQLHNQRHLSTLTFKIPYLLLKPGLDATNKL